MDACVFGGVATEYIQISEETFFKPPCNGGFTSFADLYINTPHNEYTEYERMLSLDEAVAYCCYHSGRIGYTREVFASYPDRARVVHMRAEQAGELNLRVRLVLPFLSGQEEELEPGAKKAGRLNT